MGGAEPLLSIVLPTYNERENLPVLLDRLASVLGERGVSYEIIVVDDDSPDGTWMVALEYAEKGLPVRLVRRRGERGLATAVARGIQEARGKYIVVMDADLQHPPEKVPELLDKALSEKADLVVASRNAPGGGIEEWSPWRRLVSKTATLLAHILVPWSRRTSDPMSGFFLAETSLAKKALEEPGAKSWKILLELLAHSQKTVEVPYTFKPRLRGRSKLGPREMLQYIIHLLHLSQWRPLRFALVGATGTAVNLTTVKLAYETLHTPYPLALLAGFETGLTWNYMLHDTWTFKNQRPPGTISMIKHWLRYHLATLAGLAAYMATAYTLHTLLNQNPLTSALLGILAGFTANYTLSSLHVWKQTPPPPRETGEKTLTLEAKPVKGLGEGAKYVAHPYYNSHLARILGCKPYPGTLNLEANTTWKTLAAKCPPKQIPGATIQQTRLGPVHYWHTTLTIHGKRVKALLVRPQLSKHPPNILELIACTKLKQYMPGEEKVKLHVQCIQHDQTQQ